MKIFNFFKKKKIIESLDIELFLESFYEGGILLNENHEILYFNHGCEKIFGYERKEILGQHINHLVPLEIRQKHTMYIKGMMTITEMKNKLMGKDREVYGLKKDQTKIKLEIRLNSLKLHDGSYILVVINDKSNEELLKEDLKEYKQFFDDSIDMLCMMNFDSYFIAVNDSFVNTLGYTRDYLLSNPFLDFVHQDDIEKTQNEYNKLLLGNKTFHFENRYKTFRGDYIYLSWKCITTKKCIYAIARNITDEKKIVLELEKKDKLLSNTEKLVKVGTWDWNVDTNDLYWSDGVKKIYEENNPSFENFIKIVHPDDVETVQNVIQQSLANKTEYNIKHRIQTKSGTKYLVGYGSFVSGDDGLHLRGAVVDVTEETLKSLELENALEQANQASYLKSLFVANISHEIRTPLNGIIGMTNILKEQEELGNDSKNVISHIIESSGILLSIITKVLDFSKIEAGKMDLNLSEITFSEFIQDIENHFKPFAINKGLNFYIKSDNTIHMIKCDKIKINQILYNIIANAIKFTSDGMIILTLKKENNGILFTIKDTGIGIKSEDKDKLFKPFVQADSSKTKNFEGTGLGLSICKKLVELMGGYITLESTYNIGTCVIFWIPVEFINTIEYENLEPSIIVAEDNNINQIVIKQILTKLNLNNIIICPNGQSLVEKIQNKTILPKIIFMDLHMPKMNGLDATKEIRKLGINVPIIAITANAMDGIREECLNAGMNDFLLKPYQKSDLEKMVRKWLV